MKQLQTVAAFGENAMPLRLRMRVFGDEVELLAYNTLTINSLMDRITDRIGLERAAIKAKVLEENTIRRIDNKLKDKGNRSRWTTLQDLKIVDNTPIQIEVKEEQEQMQDEWVEEPAAEDDGAGVPEGSSLASDARPADGDVNLDDREEYSPNMRACLVSTDDEPGIFQRIHADIFTTTIHDLTEILKREFKREGPHRIRDLLLKKLYSKEDEGMLLKTFSQFEEGGARVTLERGSACSINEIALKIELQDNVTKENKSQDFIFNSEYSVQKCKSEICDALGLEPTKFTLFRYDAFGAPGFAIRKEKAGWFKNNVSSGDVLALCSNDGRVVKLLSADNKFHLSIHVTNTGYSDDSKFLGEIDVSKTLKLDDLREQIATMNHFQERESK